MHRTEIDIECSGCEPAVSILSCIRSITCKAFTASWMCSADMLMHSISLDMSFCLCSSRSASVCCRAHVIQQSASFPPFQRSLSSTSISVIASRPRTSHRNSISDPTRTAQDPGMPCLTLSRSSNSNLSAYPGAYGNLEAPSSRLTCKGSVDLGKLAFTLPSPRRACNRHMFSLIACSLFCSPISV